MRNCDELVNNYAIKAENRDINKRPKDYEVMINDDKKKMNMKMRHN